MKIRFIKYIAFLSVFAAFSCSKNPSEGEGDYPYLLFSAETDDMQMKSGAGANSIKTTSANLKDHSFGVYGVYTDTEGDQNGTNVFLNSAAQEVSYDDATDPANPQWAYSPLAYWTLNKFYRFRAFHPYSGDAITLNSLSDADRIVIEYASAAGQEDLLVGFQTVESVVTNIKNKVKITFEHALSALEFKIAFKNSVDIDDDYTDNITNFYLTGLIPTGTLIYGHPDGDYMTATIDWNATYYDGSSTYFEWTGSKRFGKITLTDPDTGKAYPVSIFDGDGDYNAVFCVPQTCSASASKPTTVHFKTQSSDAENSVVLPSIEWKPGKIYTYTLLVNKSDIELEITVKDWTEIQSNEDIYL
ncbi:MAG: fimbrillin family protein [Candidatus Cryptobacteroides sp.]